MSRYDEALNNYRSLNREAKENATVFFGADWLSRIPIGELARDYGITSVYNRSLKGLVLDDAEKVLKDCVLDLLPSKVFINLGENEATNAAFDGNDFAEKYEWLLYTIHSTCNCRIYILSVVNDRTNRVNEQLKRIAERYECEYIDISACRSSVLTFFSKIRFFLRTTPLSFCEAFAIH